MAVCNFKSTATLTIFRLHDLGDRAGYLAGLKSKQIALLTMAHELAPITSSIEFGCGSFEFRLCCLISEDDNMTLGNLRKIGEASGGQWVIEDTPSPTITRGGFRPG